MPLKKFMFTSKGEKTKPVSEKVDEHIYKITYGNRPCHYYVSLTYNKKRYQKYYLSLEQAIIFRETIKKAIKKAII